MRVLTVGAAVCLLAFLFMGWDCSPSRPGCAHSATCGTVTSGGGRSHYRRCINQCMPRPSDAELTDERATCLLDPCEWDGTSWPEMMTGYQGPFACPPKTRCARNQLAEDNGLDPAMGVCVPADPAFDQCYADENQEYCEDGTHCAPALSPRVLQASALFTRPYFPNEAGGACLPPVREGARCDSNAQDAPLYRDVTTGEPDDDVRGGSFCEPGTFCVNVRQLYGDEVPDEFRCVRTCTVPSEPGLSDECACGVSQCVETAPVEDPFLGDLGNTFCTPCLSHGVECGDSPFECCGSPDGESCVESIPIYEGEDPTFRCCLPELDETNEPVPCDPSAAFDKCCEGLFCSPTEAVCQRCVTENQDYEVGGSIPCCDGLAPTLDASGDWVCGRCPPGGCDNYNVFYAAHPGATVSSYVIPADGSFWYEAETQPVSGPLSEPGVEWFTYRLWEQKRAFVFTEQSSRSGSGAPVLGADLRPDPGVPSMMPLGLPPSGGTFRSVDPNEFWDGWGFARIYDQGACSLLIDWNLIVSNLVAQMLSIIAVEGGAYSEQITHVNTALTPVYRDTARYSGVPRGLVDAGDVVALRSEFLLSDGSDTMTLVLKGRFKLDLRPGFLETGQTAVADVAIQQSNCHFLEPEREYYECVVMTGVASGVPQFETQYFWADGPDPGDEPDYSDAQLLDFSCGIDRDVYVCDIPRGSWFDTSERGSGAGGTEEYLISKRRVFYSRPVDHVAYSKDIVLDIVDSAGNSTDIEVLMDNALYEFFGADVLKFKIRQELVNIGAELRGLIGGLVGDFTNAETTDIDFFPTCSSDAQCRTSSLADTGMRRNRCVGVYDGEDYLDNRCAGLGFEPRRINIRPDGLEVVLAENLQDGVYDLLDGRGSFCDPGRHPAHDSEDDRPKDWPNMASAGMDLAVCTLGEQNCNDICPSVGMECYAAGALGLAPAGSRCHFGACCDADSVCDGACRDLQTDDAHCGGCGISCDVAGTSCRGGECVAP